VSGVPAPESPWAAYSAALVELGVSDPRVVVLDGVPPRSSPFATRFPNRFFPVAETEAALLALATERAGAGGKVHAAVSTGFLVGRSYGYLRQAICPPRADVTFCTVDAGILASSPPTGTPCLEDIGVLRGLPTMAVVVPSDAPSTRSAVHALHQREGPVYLRLSESPRPTVTDGAFQLGRAAELRSGGDLTVVALGAMVAPALALSEDLARVGVSVRVLDFASVKPFDEPSLLRAARDTGAILVLEEHSVLTGVGALVAATTTENYPVPVRRVGVPDVFIAPGSAETAFERYGLGAGRIRDEAWELLQLRGKVQ
jgi:transketolase